MTLNEGGQPRESQLPFSSTTFLIRARLIDPQRRSGTCSEWWWRCSLHEVVSKKAITGSYCCLRTSQSFLVTLKGLVGGRPSVECLDVARVEFERFVAVRYHFLVLWWLHAHITRGAVAIEHRLGMRRYLNGTRVVLLSFDKASCLVRVVAFLLQRSRKRLALLTGMGTLSRQELGRTSLPL